MNATRRPAERSVEANGRLTSATGLVLLLLSCVEVATVVLGVRSVPPGTGVMEGIGPALRAAAPPGVTVSVTGFEQIQAVGSSTGGVAPACWPRP